MCRTHKLTCLAHVGAVPVFIHKCGGTSVYIVIATAIIIAIRPPTGLLSHIQQECLPPRPKRCRHLRPPTRRIHRPSLPSQGPPPQKIRLQTQTSVTHLVPPPLRHHHRHGIRGPGNGSLHLRSWKSLCCSLRRRDQSSWQTRRLRIIFS